MIDLVEKLHISDSPYVNAMISVVLFVVIAKAIDFLIDRVVRKFTKFTESDLDDRIIDAVHRPVYFSIILLGIFLAIEDLSQSDKTAFYAGGIIFSVMSIIWAVTGIKLSNALIENGLKKISDATGLGKDILPLIENSAKVLIIIASLMVILSIWRINITPVLASAGIAGVAVAIAAKDTLSNFFGGISIFIDKPYKLGDFIVLEKGERGEVVSIGLRSTKIKTADDVLITVPNSIISATRVMNESAPAPSLRLKIPVSVAYGSDIDRVEALLLEIARSNVNILSEPSPAARFKSFGESGLDFELLCWAKEPIIKELAIHQLNSAIYKTFNAEGISIPFPRMDIHLASGEGFQYSARPASVEKKNG